MEIWIDGALVSRIEDNRGLNGNQNALILGASNSGASIARFLKGGRLARIRSDKSRINFGARCIPYETWLDQQNSKF